MGNVGFRIFSKIKRPPKSLVMSFEGLATPNIADNMNRFFCIAAEIKALNQGHLLGTAFTVKTRATDNLIIHKALDMAEPGDIIVIDAQGDLTNSVAGEIMVRYAMSRGIAGFLVDGAIRDLGALKNLDFPVFARGVNPKGPYKDGPGEINVPVVCGGVVINPGDIIVGDEDGVVVIAPNEAAEVLTKAKEMQEKEKKIFKAIEKNQFDREWVDQTLTAKGCEVIDSTYEDYSKG